MDESKAFNNINKKYMKHSQSSLLIHPQKKTLLNLSDKKITMKVKIKNNVFNKQPSIKLNLKNLESFNINKQISVLSNRNINKSNEKNVNQIDEFHNPSSTNIPAEVRIKSQKEYLNSNRIELNNSNENDLEMERTRDENQVKKLNFWEMQRFMLNDKAVSEKSNISHNISRSESMNYLKEVKERLENLRFKKSSHLQDIDKKSEEEQGTILMQNIKSTKKKFDFGVFFKSNKKNEEKSLKNKVLFIKDKSISHDSDSTMVNHNAIIENEIRVKVEGGYETLKSPDLYREIIKEKTRQENVHLMELMKTSQNLYDKKKEKNEKYFQCILSLKKKEKELIDLDKAEYEKAFDGKVKSLESDQSKNSLNRNKSSIGCTDEFIFLKNEYQRNMDSLNNKLERTKRSYEQEKTKFILQILEHKKNKKDIENEIKNLKNLYNTLAQEQIVYYNEIVKRGIDVRYEGLSWAVKRLVELNAHLDYSNFPRFLDHNQIDYLMKISYKQVESGQFKIMLKALKSRQKKLRYEENSEFMKNSKNSFNSTNTSSFLFQGANNTARLNKTSFSNNTIQHFDNVFKKYDKLMRLTYEQKIEDLNIQGIVDELREKLRHYKSDNKINLDCKATSNIKVFFDENKKHKEYFEEILLLRQKIEELDKEISLIKEEAIKTFRKKYDNLKSMSSKFSIQYDMIYSALFGNL